MKSEIRNFPQFLKAIRHDELVYLFGTGISASLTGKPYSWWKWIQDGISHMKDKELAKKYRDSLTADDSADNIQLIPYGDDYDDLPAFLEDMAQERLRYFVQKNAIVGRTGFQHSEQSADPLMKYHYSQESIPFSGRKRELEELKEFIECEDKFCWWVITGQAGAGKSRLALQFLKKLPCTWFGFFLHDGASSGDIRNFQPFSNMVIVVDYVGGRESVVAEFMKGLYQVFIDCSYSLRILLIERENSRNTGSWHSKLILRLGKYNDIAKAEYKKEFLDIGDLDSSSVESFIGSVCLAKSLSADKDRDCRLRTAYGEKFERLQFRPLFVQIFVEAWIENGFFLPRYDAFEDLLQFLLQREQERWLSLLDNDQSCCNSFLNLLLRANITGELKIKELPDLYKTDWERVNRFITEHSFPGRQKLEEARTIINSVCQNMDGEDGAIVPLFPDIIKEYMFFYYMDEERLPRVMSEIWQNAAHDFSLFITRCMTDFPENEFYPHALNMYEKEASDVDILRGRLEMLQKRVIYENDDPAVLLEIIDNEHSFWENVVIPEEDTEQSDLLAALKVSGLHMVARQYGGWSVYDMSSMLAVIDEALAVPGGKATKFIKRLCLQEHISQLSRTGFSIDAARLQVKLTDMIREEPENSLNACMDMINKNTEMMNHLLSGDAYQAAMVFKKMRTECSYKDKEAVKVLAHSCFNLEHFMFLLQKEKYRGMGLAAAEKLSFLFPDEDVVHIRLLGCKAVEYQWQYLVDRAITDDKLLELLNELDRGLEGISFGDETINEAIDMTWGVIKTLRLNVVDKDKKELEKIIRDGREILSRYPNLTSILTTLITAVHALHKNAEKNKVSHEEVEELFRYVEMNYDSGTAREAFFRMLEDSEDRKNRQDYLTKWVRVGALQDARYSLYGSGLEEFDMEEEMLRAAMNYRPRETYRRSGSKVGANDPCPCGSGKKFKKCCRGKILKFNAH